MAVNKKATKKYYQKEKDATAEDLVPVNFKWPLWLKKDIQECASANMDSASKYVMKIMIHMTAMELKKLKKKSHKP